MLKVFMGVKKVLGVFVRFFAKTIFVLVMIFSLLLTIALGYVGLHILPIVDEYREKSYDIFDTIDSHTFSKIEDTIIYDSDKNVIAEINIGNYEYVNIEDVSDWVSKGYIATEDKRFKVHNGIDVKGLLRAFVSLLRHNGNITQGGSTITQQVVKNSLLNQERTFERKFLEIFLALDLEKEYTKQEIMEYYVNTCFYGNNCYGIQAASHYYFDKEAKDLNLTEGAFLVGISNNASFYNPKVRLDECLKRWKFVLGELKEEGYLTEEEYQESLKESLNFAYNREQRAKESYQVSYAIHSATLNLMEQNGFEFKYIFRNEDEYNEYRNLYSEEYSKLSNLIREGGYKIYTSLNTEMQGHLQEIVDEALKDYKTVSEDGRFEFQAATVVVNNETGYVEVIIGGRGTEDEFNRGFLARRQPGSSIKPLVVYAPAFETGEYYPSLVMNDVDDITDKYYPQNVGNVHYGNVSIREALGRSLNTIAYQIMKDIKPITGLHYLEKMRFTSLSYLDTDNTSVALGGFTYGATVVDMAKGYSTIANMGKYIDNNCIVKILYNDEPIFIEDNHMVDVYDEDVAYLTIDCAKSVLYESYGGARSRRPETAIAFAKTGTTNSSKDIWFCGSSVYYACAVWAGYDNPKETGLYGSGLTGAIWKEIMDYLHESKEPIDFIRPTSVVDLPINYNGTRVEYNTGRTDIFSQNIIDKSIQKQKELEENKKIEEDDILISNIETELSNLRNYIIEDIDAFDYISSKYVLLETEIYQVYQSDKQKLLYNELENIKKYFSVDMRDMMKYLERETEIKKYREYIDKKKSVELLLTSLQNIYIDENRDLSTQIENIDNIYLGIERAISALSSSEDKSYYQGIYNGIKNEKEISIQAYRNKLKEQRALRARENIVYKLNILRTYTLFDDTAKVLEKEIELMLSDYESSYGEISDLKMEFYDILSHLEIPEENISEDEDIAESEDTVENTDIVEDESINENN